MPEKWAESYGEVSNTSQQKSPDIFVFIPVLFRACFMMVDARFRILGGRLNKAVRFVQFRRLGNYSGFCAWCLRANSPCLDVWDACEPKQRRENNNSLGKEEILKNKCLGWANQGERILPEILQGCVLFKAVKSKVQQIRSPVFSSDTWVNVLHRSTHQVNRNCAVRIYPATNLTSDWPQQWYSVTNVVFKEGWTNFLSHWAQTKHSDSVKNPSSSHSSLTPNALGCIYCGQC